ncbi:MULTISPECIES: Rid family hydrolase [unclassified Bradyrhizobium]
MRGQASASFAKLERVLEHFKTDKRYLLSAHVQLSNLDDKKDFDIEWKNWVGDSPDHRPQRACVGATLSPGTLVEISVVAAKARLRHLPEKPAFSSLIVKDYPLTAYPPQRR